MVWSRVSRAPRVPGLGSGQHFHGGVTQAEVVHDMVDIRLPSHQVPAAVGHRRAEFQAVQVGVGLRRVHPGTGVFHVPLFLAAGHALDVEAAVRSPGAVQPALGVLVGAAHGLAIAVLVIVRFVVTGGQPQPGFVAADGGTAVDQPAVAIVGAADGEVAGAGAVTEVRRGGGGHHLAARRWRPSAGCGCWSAPPAPAAGRH